ncbi:MAG: ABC transporter ATP-binding protein, partial [Acidimicrobiia bacterium]|nr:ABC transporter ATP-binding protein [Acidimicrobiia bacterium]
MPEPEVPSMIGRAALAADAASEMAAVGLAADDTLVAAPAPARSQATTAAPPPAQQRSAVSLYCARKRLGTTNALDGMSLSIPEGEVTVLLGPNGAGKTTAIRVVTGALPLDSGSVEVLGLDPQVHGETVRRSCGVVSAKPALYDRLSGWDNLRYAAELYGLGRADEAIRAATARFGIERVLDQKVGGFSTGMKTRLALARSVLHDPELLLLDEPTSGLDPESSYAVLGLIREYARAGSTVLLCTHLLAEAEGLADRIVVLDGGRDLAAGTPEELMSHWWPDAQVRIAADDPASLQIAARIVGVTGGQWQPDGSLTLRIDDPARTPDVVAALVGAGVRLTRVTPFEPTLEDLYFAVRGVTRGA